MSIWTSKARAFAVLAVIALAGCDTLPASQPAGGAKAITQASLARGAVRLAAPEGYCIDQRSLRDRFALLGRCDTLGVDGFFRDRDLAIIATSTTPVEPGTVTPSASALAAAPGEDVVDRVERNGLTLVKLRGETGQIEGVDPSYWRTAVVVNGQLMSLVLYAPPDSDALGGEGARVLERAVQATRNATSQLAG